MMLCVYASKEEATKYVNAKVASGQWVLRNEKEVWWLHTNAEGRHEHGSVYGAGTAEDAVEQFVIDRARAIGYCWAFLF